MLKRTITGFFVTVAVYSVLYFAQVPNLLLCAAASLCIFAVYEIYSVTGYVGNEALLTVSLIAVVGLVFADIPGYQSAANIIFLIAVLTFVLLMLFQKRCSLKHPLKALYLAAVIAMLIRSVPELGKMKMGTQYLTAAVTLCFVTDISAYLIGRFFGRHKLAPTISPNKTIEGSLAGILSSVIVLMICGLVFENTGAAQVDFLRLGIYAALTSVVGEFGDLAMSVVKRICGAKDYGNLLPGHGGILDRFDSHIFAIAFTLSFCSIAGGFIL